MQKPLLGAAAGGREAMLTFVSCRACLGCPLLPSFFFLSPSRVSDQREVRSHLGFLTSVLRLISSRGRTEQGRDVLIACMLASMVGECLLIVCNGP